MERDAFGAGCVAGAVMSAIVAYIIMGIMCCNRVLVAEWRDVPVEYQSETLRVPSRIKHAGVEYECALVDSAKPNAYVIGSGSSRSLKFNGEWWVLGAPLPSVNHVHEWSRTLDGVPTSGAECLDCGEVQE